MSRVPGIRARLLLVLVAVVSVVSAPVAGPAQGTGPDTLPLPRFVSLAADRVNARSGPGPQYPIRWVYERAGLPVKIVAEFGDAWRKIQDGDGDEGWVRGSLLSGRRTIMVTGRARALRRSPSESGLVVLEAEPGVIGRLLDCRPNWCRVEIGETRGWMARGDFWGLLDGE